jgi:hypothetical protein
MNTTETHAVHGAIPEWFAGEAAGRSVAEAIGAIGAVILAVIGLAGLLSNLLAAIATIVIGAGILAEGWSVSSTYRQQWSSAGAATIQGSRAGGGVTAEFLGGIAGIVLGILGLFRENTNPAALLAVALLVYGATLVLSSFSASAAFWRTATFTEGGTQSSMVGAVPVAHSGHLLVGLGAVVLGILAVVGLAPIVLVLVGLLSLGAVLLLGQLRFP